MFETGAIGPMGFSIPIRFNESVPSDGYLMVRRQGPDWIDEIWVNEANKDRIFDRYMVQYEMNLYLGEGMFEVGPLGWMTKYRQQLELRAQQGELARELIRKMGLGGLYGS